MEPVFFENQSELRQWFEHNHARASELWVGFYKKESGKPSITWPQSVDQALCFGWIDGIRKSIDKESYVIRFTPRNPKSNWSKINIAKVEDLVKQGLMRPAGLLAFGKREDSKSGVYSYENEPVDLDSEFQRKFADNKTAWMFFQSQAPSYQRVSIRWVMSAKQPATRLSRLNILIRDCADGLKIKPLRFGEKDRKRKSE